MYSGLSFSDQTLRQKYNLSRKDTTVLSFKEKGYSLLKLQFMTLTDEIFSGGSG